VHEVQINVVDTQRLQRGVNTLVDPLVPWVVELGGDPDLLSRNPRVLDPLADLSLISIGKSCVDVSVSLPERVLYGLRDFVGL